MRGRGPLSFCRVPWWEGAPRDGPWGAACRTTSCSTATPSSPRTGSPLAGASAPRRSPCTTAGTVHLSLKNIFSPFATVIGFFVDFCVCPTFVPYPANGNRKKPPSGQNPPPTKTPLWPKPPSGQNPPLAKTPLWLKPPSG